jgi:hypothetical protein
MWVTAEQYDRHSARLFACPAEYVITYARHAGSVMKNGKPSAGE